MVICKRYNDNDCCRRIYLKTVVESESNRNASVVCTHTVSGVANAVRQEIYINGKLVDFVLIFVTFLSVHAIRSRLGTQ